jgi:hypothetical protein
VDSKVLFLGLQFVAVARKAVVLEMFHSVPRDSNHHLSVLLPSLANKISCCHKQHSQNLLQGKKTFVATQGINLELASSGPRIKGI